MADQHNDEAPRLKSRRGWWLGIFFIFMVSVQWAGGSILAQHIFIDIGYNSPFVFTYIASSAISTCLPIYLFLSLLGFLPKPPIRDKKAEDSTVYKELEVNDGAACNDEAGDIHEADDDEATAVDEAMDRRLVSGDSSSVLVPELDRSSDGVVAASVVGNGSSEVEKSPARPSMKSHVFMLKVGASLSVVWFLTQWSYMVSLASTSVTSSTIIANSSVLFTYIFNIMAKTERFNHAKTFGVTLALLGAVAVGLADKGKDGSNESLWGDAASLASAVGYAVYSMILAVQCPSDDDVSMALVMGYMGGVCVVLFLPLLVVLGLAPGVRVLSGLTLHVVGLVVFKSYFDNLLSELLWARAILLTTPTVATVGCSLTIPIAFASDFILHGLVPKALSVLGALLMAIGFCFVGGGDDGGSGAGLDAGGGGGGRFSSAGVVECLLAGDRRRMDSATSSCSRSHQSSAHHGNNHIE